MRTALISDLHGNEIALNAVLDHAHKYGVDRFVCLGDVATLGPRPVAVLERLQELGCACILGNHDEFMLRPELVYEYTKYSFLIDAVHWCREQLSPPHLDFIRGFARTLELDLGGSQMLFAFHGTPHSNTQDLLCTTSSGELNDMLKGSTPDVMACGHTHIQMLRQHDGRWIVNPGSVGLPFKEYMGGGPPMVLAHAEYAVIQSKKGMASVVLHRIELDKTVLREAARAVPFPMSGQLVQAYA